MLTIDKFYNARIVLENILRKTDLVHTKKGEYNMRSVS